ncbi:hypothetical protein DAMA08_019030 [Martiniozyma asiatica (nom. inval.)]|nr:hypothetical protein DAMA08_019030 [Martiniozyma asiatica]
MLSPRSVAALGRRLASTVHSPYNDKMISLLQRLHKFEEKANVFEKLEELHLLCQRKGLCNPKNNSLEFTCNNNTIQRNINNLKSFNDLGGAAKDHFMRLAVAASYPASATSAGGYFSTTAHLTPMPRSNTPSVKLNTSSSAIKAIPGFNAFASNYLPSKRPVDVYLNTLHRLAQNDVELIGKLNELMSHFEDESDFFFNYVLEYWLSGKAFNKTRVKEQAQRTGKANAISVTNIK